MYNDSYYSRRGRTIERKKVDNGQVINPRLIPIYYNYLKDNGLFPAPPPAPPVHVDDGTCIAVDYSPFQSYSFPEVITSLTDALGTLLFNLGIDVDITKVDHIILSINCANTGSNNDALSFFESASSYSVGVGNYGTSSSSYDLTFVRDYSQSDTVFYLAFTRSRSSSYMDDLVTLSQKYTRVSEGTGGVRISRIVVATLTE